MNRGNCRACGAPILWVKSVKGRTMPLNVAPVEDGNVTLDKDGVATVHPPGTMFYEDEVRYTSHFSTCPNADEFRTRR